jgi:hypothetical protein
MHQHSAVQDYRSGSLHQTTFRSSGLGVGVAEDGMVVFLVFVYHGVLDNNIVQYFLVKSLYRFVNGSDNGFFGHAASVRTHVDAKSAEGKTAILKSFG